MAIDKSIALIGSFLDEENGIRLGSAYLYEFIAQPGQLTAGDGESGNLVRISWNNRSNNVEGFKIYRDGIEIGSTVLAASVFIDFGAIAGKIYAYEVSVYNNFWGESPRTMANFGWRRANGRISGKVQTDRGLEIAEVEVSIAPTSSSLTTALDFDGKDDYVQIPHIPKTNETTISAWVKTSSDSDQQILAWGHTDSNHTIEFKVSDGKLVYAEWDGSSRSRLQSESTVNSNDWRHVAVVVYGDSAQFFIDGIATEQASDVRRITTTNTLAIGAYKQFGKVKQPFDGEIDEVRLWNIARTGPAIKTDMYRLLQGNEPGLVGYWTFDDSTRSGETLAADYTHGGGHHGKIIGAVWSSDTPDVKHRAVTDVNGDYDIRNMYYDEGREFRVTPDKERHGFDPEFTDLYLETAGGRTVSFTDTTTFSVKGQIQFAGTLCGVEGVEIFLNGEATEVLTDAEGKFALAIEEPDQEYTITPTFGDSGYAHLFQPHDISLTITEDVDGLQFWDTESRKLFGKVRGGCIAGLGTAQIRITSSANPACLDTTIVTDFNGNFRPLFPAQEYSIELIQIDNADSSAILEYFSPVTVDLSREDQRQNFIYHPPPIIQLSIFPEETTCDSIPIMRQFKDYFLLIEVLEEYEGQVCLVANGTVSIFDDIGGNPAQPVTLELKNGRAEYTLTAGEPNILGGGPHPYQKLLQVTADVDSQTASLDQWVLVTGHRPRTPTFASTTPELPLMILRHPPGDQSYSFQSKGSTIINRYSFAFEETAGGGVFADVRLGFVGSTPDTPAGVPTTNFGAYVFLTGSVSAGGGFGGSRVFTTTLTTTEEFRTSEGDVFIGASMNQVFALTDVIDYDRSSCQVVRDTSLALEVVGFETTYIYTEDHIRNTVIPQLQLLTILQPDSVASNLKINAAIAVWQQALAMNDKLKDDAKFERNLSFGGDTQTTYTSTMAKDSAHTFEFTTFIEEEAALGLGVVITGVPLEIGVKTKFQITTRITIHDITNSQETTLGYSLGDDDIGDFFSVDIKKDRYGPVFELVAGTSSCPWEPGTQPRDGVQLAIDTFIQQDVPPDEPATFILSLGNTSESGEARAYDLRVIQLSNPDGAIIRVGGVPMGNALSYFIPAGDSAYTATLTVERGPLAFDYENLQLMLAPPCEYDEWLARGELTIADTVTFSAHFSSSLSNLNLLYPNSGWSVGSSDQESVPIIINDYDPYNEYLENIKLQYRQPLQAWLTVFEIPYRELPADYIVADWDVSDLPDGKYELRAVSDGGNEGVTYSSTIHGRIDRRTLLVLGTPEPSDGVLNVGENPSIRLSGALDCASIDAERQVSLRFADDDTRIDVTLNCNGETLHISPSLPFSQLANRTLIAKVSDIRAVNGKILRKAVSWSFRVDPSQVYWTSAMVSSTVYKNRSESITSKLNNTSTDTLSFNISRFPAWLTPSPLSGEIAPESEIEITFTIDRQLDTGLHQDTVFVETSHGQQLLEVSIDVLHEAPAWQINPSVYTYSMNVTAQLILETSLSDDVFDLLSVYVDNEIRGVTHVEYVPAIGRFVALITVYSNVPSGEPLTFRLWDASTGKEYAYFRPDYFFSSNASYGSLTNPILIEPDASFQTFSMNSGWTWFSNNVETRETSLDEALMSLSPRNGDLIKSQIGFSQYLEGTGWIGNLESIETGKSYHINLSSPDQLRLVGEPVDLSNTSIPVDSGWNWIGYMNDVLLDVNNALSSLKPATGDRIKSQNQFADYDVFKRAWLGDLKVMTPGQGYLLKISKPGDLLYPDLSKEVVDNQSTIAFAGKPEWSLDVKAYEYNMTMTGLLEFNGQTLSSSDDIIGAFVGETCRGLAQPIYVPELEGHFVFLTIYSDTAEGDSVRFQVYDSKADDTRKVENTVLFKSDDIGGQLLEPYVYTALANGDELVPYEFYLNQNYPNPFNPETTIEYGIPTDQHVELVIYNILGQKVTVLVDEKQSAGRYKVSFNETRFGLASGVYFYLVKAGKFAKAHKLLLLK